MESCEPDHEICVDATGGTVWVNAIDGSCIGRFSKRFGIDVHRTATAQLAGEDQCLMCTHEPGDAKAWADFVEAMRYHHGVEVPRDTLAWPASAPVDSEAASGEDESDDDECVAERQHV